MHVNVDMHIDKMLSWKTSPKHVVFVHDTIDTCRGEDDKRNHNLPPHMMTSKTTPKTTISQILICWTNMLSPITFSRPTRHQPKQELQLYFHKMQCLHHFLWGPRVIPHKIQCPRHFFMRFRCHPHQQRIPRESAPSGTAGTSFAYMELTCPPCVRLWGPWKTMFHVMSHKKQGQIGQVISIFLIFLARQL